MLSVGFGLKKLKSMKYNVSFIQDNQKVVLVDGLIDVQACQYAINLHQSSNRSHEIQISSDSTNELLLVLKK